MKNLKLLQRLLCFLYLSLITIPAYTYNDDDIQIYRLICDDVNRRDYSSGNIIQKYDNDIIAFTYYSQSKMAVFESKKFNLYFSISGKCKFESNPWDCILEKGGSIPGRIERFSNMEKVVQLITEKNDTMSPLLQLIDMDNKLFFNFNISFIEAYNSKTKQFEKRIGTKARDLLRLKLGRELCPNFESTLAEDLIIRQYTPWE